MNPSRPAGRVPPPTRKLVVRKAASQRDLRPVSERITLERVLGLSVPETYALACDPVTGLIAYPAGCVVVLFNPRKNKQSFIINSSKKTITALSFSKDGKSLVTGESGHMPSVRVWDVEDEAHPQISEMEKGHKFGVQCVSFSPNMKYVVSVGYHHDMLVNIWDSKSGSKLASNKVSSKVCSFSFSPCGSYFMTSGVRHVKFWYLDSDSKKKSGKTMPLFGRSALLNDQRNNTFCGVACGKGENADTIYSVTKSGLLCSFDSKKRVLEQYVELRASKARCITVSEQYIFCGCTDGIIRVFDPSTLKFITTLPKPHYLGVNVAEGIDPSHLLSKKENATYADTIAMALDGTNNRLTCVYSDRSLYIWDLTDIKKIGKIYSALYHRDCVWGVEVYPSVTDNKQAALPPGTFLTCSSDDTVRVWNVQEGADISFPRNIYSKELMRVLYTDKEGDVPSSKNSRETGNDSKGGVRSIRISPDGQLLALGDRSGNVRVYDLMFFDELITIEAHESEVLCVEFSPPVSDHKFIATAGRDRLIHVFDMSSDYNLMQTLDDHSASIMSVKFNVTENNDFQLLSCGADKSMIFRSAQKSPDLQFVRTTNYVGKTTLYDMDIESASRKYAATAGQDRNVRVYDVVTGKQARCFKGSQGDDGTLIRICLDSSGLYVATSCSDKSLYMCEFDTGECVASMLGHSEIVTGLKFTADCKNLISVSGDGCIFIWKIPKLYTENMIDKLVELGREPPKQPETPYRRGTYKVNHSAVLGDGNTNGFGPATDPSKLNEISPPVPDYRFSVGQLPFWAKKQLIAKEGVTSLSPEEQSDPVQPGGRWAQRLNNDGSIGQGPMTPIRIAEEEEVESPYTLTPISLHEQMQALRNSPLERRCSLTRGEDDDLFPQNGRAQVEALRPNDELGREGNGGMPATVTMSRGSEGRPVRERGSEGRPARERGSSIISLEAGEIKFEQALELAEDDVKESIIYLPATQDDFDSEVARSFRVTSAQKPQRLSLNLQDIEGTEADVTENHANSSHKKTAEGSSEEDDEAFTPTDDVVKSVTDKPEGGESEGEDKCSRYFESLGSSSEKEKQEPIKDEKLAPLDSLHSLGHRLSISARFLSRSQTSSVRSVTSLDSDEKKEALTPAEEHKLEIKKRKEEMARAVSETRKRLESLGWKSAREMPTSNSSAVTASSSTITSSVSVSSSTVTMTTPRTVTSSELDLIPVSTRTSPTSKLPVATSLSESRFATAADPKIVNGGQAVPEKDHSPPKRSASDLIAFFSHPKFSSLKSKNKDKEDKEKEKEKDKEKKDKEKEEKDKEKERKEKEKEDKKGKEKEKEKEKKERKDKEKEDKKGQEKEKKEKKDKEDKKGQEKEKKGKERKDKDKEDKKGKEREKKGKEKDENEKGKKEKEKEVKVSGAAEKDRSSPNSKLPRRNSADELNPNSTGKSWRKSLGIGNGSSKQEKERKTSVPLSSKPPPSTAASTSALSRIDEAKSDKRVQLREKKGRVTAEERRAKSHSVGDVGKQLKKVEVSILDPSAPPTRTVSTIDIPDKVDTEENSALYGKRPKSATAAEEKPTTGELKSVSMSVELSPRSENQLLAESSLKKLPPPDVIEEAKYAAAENSPNAGEQAEASASAPDSPVWRRRVPIDAASSPARSSPSSSGGVASPKARASELPKESSSVASVRSPPQPVRRPLQASAAGQEKGVTQSADSIAHAAEEAVQNLVRAFQSVADIHEKALEQEPNEERQHVLSMLSATFGAMGEECFQRKPVNLPRQTGGMGARRFGSPYSFSTGNLDSLVPRTAGPRRISESSACIPEVIQEEKEVLSDHLEKYSDMLVELVKAKLLK